MHLHFTRDGWTAQAGNYISLILSTGKKDESPDARDPPSSVEASGAAASFNACREDCVSQPSRPLHMLSRAELLPTGDWQIAQRKSVSAKGCGDARKATCIAF